VAGIGGFQEQVRRLGELVSSFDQMPDCPQKTAGRELLQLLMEVHGQGLERILEILFESPETGNALIDALAKDEVAGSLLLLYSLHPDGLETRVHEAVDRLRPRLRKSVCSIELLGVDEGAVRVRLATTGHTCGSSSKELRSTVEEALYEAAPDLVSLEITGPDEPTSQGFVALSSLVDSAHAGQANGFAIHVGSAK